MSHKSSRTLMSMSVAGLLLLTTSGPSFASAATASKLPAVAGPPNAGTRLLADRIGRKENRSETSVSGDAPMMQASRDACVEPQACYDRAVYAFQGGDYRTALQLARKAADGADSNAYLALVIQSMFALRDYDAAAAQIRAAVAAGPLIDWGTLYRFYGYHVKGYADQLSVLTAFVDGHPKDANAHFLLGYQYMIVGKRELARQQFAQVLRLSPLDDFAAELYAQN